MTNEKREKLIEVKEEELGNVTGGSRLDHSLREGAGAAQSHGRGYQAA